jgi:hypothetical protein
VRKAESAERFRPREHLKRGGVAVAVPRTTEPEQL